MSNRKEISFIELLEDENKSIIIPIIQRDYAQGREDKKAVKVRNRLITDWIAVLNDPDRRMDFNFIYGEETKDENDPIFLPVDGQQRLTSLYLLHWYLAYKTNNSSRIVKWKFDYKTRNSASEFFAFLRSDRAIDLYNKLISDQNKLSSIKDTEWFKMKWENDPTVNACISFLCTLSDKISECEKKDNETVSKFWGRLSDPEKPAIYFTYLPEKNDDSEIHAARTYTRMNARGKRLTDFENLKAMIDELEERLKNDGRRNYSVSDAFDRIYIDHLYNKDITLAETTKYINEKSLRWFRHVYYVYYLGIKKTATKYKAVESNYEDEIYNLSQGRKADSSITEYLRMLKAVLETICYSECSIKDTEILMPDIPSRNTIAFVLFVYYKWTEMSSEHDQKEKNKELAAEWTKFRELLSDLKYESWNCSDLSFACIISKMVEKYDNVTDYCVSHDFENDSPFDDWGILSDLKCRVLECKIMWHLIKANEISETEIRKFKDKNNGRAGYLFYLCGYLANNGDWNPGNWGSRTVPVSAHRIKDYIKVIDCIFDSKQKNDYYFRAVYAYASQYNISEKKLMPQDDINTCNNEHVWSDYNLNWNDTEYQNLEHKKIIQLNHFQTMLHLMLQFKPVSISTWCYEYYKSIQNTVISGYEKCWLRLALQYEAAWKYLLNYNLVNNGGDIFIDINDKKYDAALYTFFLCSGYKENRNIILDNLRHGTGSFCIIKESNIKFGDCWKLCVFQEKTQFTHSSNSDNDFETPNSNKVNMDLGYELFLDLNSFFDNNKEQYATFEIKNDKIEIRKYKNSDAENGKRQIKTECITLDSNEIKRMKERFNEWSNTLDEIVQYPSKNPNTPGNYDIWLDLRAGEDQCIAKLNKNGVKANFSGSRRKKWTWTEEIKITPEINESYILL